MLRSDTFDRCFECQVSKCSVAAQEAGHVARLGPSELGYGEGSTGLKVKWVGMSLGSLKSTIALANKILQLIRSARSAKYARCALIAKLIAPFLNGGRCPT